MTDTVIPNITPASDQPRADLAVLPVGSFEQHGPYLPLGTDTLIAVAIATSISGHHNTFQLPPLTFGCSHEHAAFAGTLSITATTLAAVIGDIAHSLAEQYVRGLMIVNAPGDNAVLTNVVQQADRPGAPIRLGLYPSRDDWTEAREAADITSSSHDDMHAGELETSILLAAYPEYLRDGWAGADHTAADRRYLTTLGIAAYTDSGVHRLPQPRHRHQGQKNPRPPRTQRRNPPEHPHRTAVAEQARGRSRPLGRSRPPPPHKPPSATQDARKPALACGVRKSLPRRITARSAPNVSAADGAGRRSLWRNGEQTELSGRLGENFRYWYRDGKPWSP